MLVLWPHYLPVYSCAWCGWCLETWPQCDQWLSFHDLAITVSVNNVCSIFLQGGGDEFRYEEDEEGGRAADDDELYRRRPIDEEEEVRSI
jgi:hypothetical protein